MIKKLLSNLVKLCGHHLIKACHGDVLILTSSGDNECAPPPRPSHGPTLLEMSSIVHGFIAIIAQVIQFFRPCPAEEYSRWSVDVLCVVSLYAANRFMLYAQYLLIVYQFRN